MPWWALLCQSFHSVTQVFCTLWNLASLLFFFLLLQHSDINTFEVISAQDWDEVASLSLVSAFRVTELNGAFWPYFRLPLSSSKIDMCQMPGNTIEKMIHPVILIMLLWAKYNWVSQLILLSTPWNIVISSIEFWYAGQAILGLNKALPQFFKFGNCRYVPTSRKLWQFNK